ncbi:MAG TPA: hypothetical protein PKK51_11825 [Rhodocyclaceae bacterium]|nr:hypothetical protein [Rhodocyclaceae bacterium]
MSAFTQDGQREKAKALAAESMAYQNSLISNDPTMTEDQKRARSLESNIRRVAPRYQGTGVAQMFGAQATPAPGSKTLLGQ